MATRNPLNRRSLLQAAGSLAGLAAVGAMSTAFGEAHAAERPRIVMKNEEFYDAGGKFVVEKGKDAILTLARYHGYPVFPGLREGLWVSDYGLGHFTEVGLAAFQFMNEEKGNYLQMDLFLLPNQMLPEHYHLKTDKAREKMEGWLCRYGRSYVYGEGPRTENMHAKIPAFEKEWVSVFHEVRINPGQSAHLARPTSRHWQFAGPEGVILTEVGTFHDGAGVRHSDPKIVFG